MGTSIQWHVIPEMISDRTGVRVALGAGFHLLHWPRASPLSPSSLRRIETTLAPCKIAEGARLMGFLTLFKL